VVVDETQDMNAPQLEMIQRLVRKGGRVVVVGDEFQAIYGFRGAVQDGMRIMRQALAARTLPMTVTRRCGKAIVALAQLTVADYKAADDAPEGEVVACDQVQLLDKVKVGDAILSRINAPLMSVCLQLLKRGTPARIEGKDIGKQLLGIVKKLNAKSVPDFFKRLSRWEDKQLSRLKNAKNNEAKCAAVRDTRETLEAVAEGCASVAEIADRILSLFQDSDKPEGQKPAVVLSSVHKAKGLEWDRTFMLGWTFNKRKPKRKTFTTWRSPGRNIH
jgi:superfamily I DNA/RNA helicase